VILGSAAQVAVTHTVFNANKQNPRRLKNPADFPQELDLSLTRITCARLGNPLQHSVEDDNVNATILKRDMLEIA
jgi:hypothetical protein